VRASYTKEQILELVRLANRVTTRWRRCQIVIAALRRRRRAGAAELSLACDIRAAAHATFALPERCGAALRRRRTGAPADARRPARALEIICTGRELDATEMERLGLVLAVHPADRLLPEAQRLAARIAASGPLATRAAKRIVTTRLLGGFAEAARAVGHAPPRRRVEPRHRTRARRRIARAADAVHRTLSPVAPRGRTLGRCSTRSRTRGPGPRRSCSAASG